MQKTLGHTDIAYSGEFDRHQDDEEVRGLDRCGLVPAAHAGVSTERVSTEEETDEEGLAGGIRLEAPRCPVGG